MIEKMWKQANEMAEKQWDNFRLGLHVESREAEYSRQDTVMFKEYITRLRQRPSDQDRDVCMAQFVVDRVHDDPSVQMLCMMIFRQDEDDEISYESICDVMEKIIESNAWATRWEAMMHAELVQSAGPDHVELAVDKLANYVRYMGFKNDWEREKP